MAKIEESKKSQEQLTKEALEKAKETSQLSSADAVDKQVAELQEANLQQKISKGISDAAAEANKQMNSMLSGMLQPIYDLITQFKDVPPKIRSIVDVDGAANGMYSQLGKMVGSMTQLSNVFVSSEVPITVDDYYADPSQYSNLMAIEYQRNEITEEDCLSSGYTKVEWEVSKEYLQSLKDMFSPPQDRDVVGKQMEKVIGTAIKAAWQMVQTPIKVIAGVANIGPIPGMIQTIVDAVDAIVQIASKPIPEKKLDEMLAQKTLAQEQGKAEAEKAKTPDQGGSMSLTDRLKKAKDHAADVANQAYDGVKAGIKESFANFEAPSIPDDVKETIDDFQDAICMVKDNIMNIYTVILLKMMGCVFKCFNQILGIIGVPSIPAPLSLIPQILADSVKVMQFIMGLPMSLVQCLKAIIKRKMKAIQIAMTPAPPLPIPEQIPVPPTSNDVVKPQTSWDDVKTALTEDYKFSSSDADEIISKVQAFYDGSGEDAEIITNIRTPDSLVKEGEYDELPVFGKRLRFKMTPLYCKDTWIPENVEKMDLIGEGYCNRLNPPIKISETEQSGRFYVWTAEGQQKLDHEGDWSLLKDYTSAEIPN